MRGDKLETDQHPAGEPGHERRRSERPASRLARWQALAACDRLAMVGARSAAAGSRAAARCRPTRELVLEIRKGQLIRLERPAAAVFVADPEVADVQAHSPTLVYVFGRRSGTTSLFAVDENEDVLLRRDVVVEHHLSGLQERDPRGRPRRAASRSARSTAASSSKAPSATPVKAQELREIASRYLGENETLINRITVAAPTQVNLRVRVAEVSREVTKLFGINWEGIFSPATSCSASPPDAPSPPPAACRSSRAADTGGVANSLSGSYSNGDVSINGIIDALEREGLVNVLAEPNLTALSGETASFLAGGEFPVPVGQDDNNNIEIQFKQFGVSLAFTPTVLSAGRISLRVRPGGQRPERQGCDQAQRPGHPRAVDPAGRDHGRARQRPELRHRRPDLQHHPQQSRQGAGARRPAGARHAVPLDPLPAQRVRAGDHRHPLSRRAGRRPPAGDAARRARGSERPAALIEGRLARRAPHPGSRARIGGRQASAGRPGRLHAGLRNEPCPGTPSSTVEACSRPAAALAAALSACCADAARRRSPALPRPTLAPVAYRTTRSTSPRGAADLTPRRRPICAASSASLPAGRRPDRQRRRPCRQRPAAAQDARLAAATRRRVAEVLRASGIDASSAPRQARPVPARLWPSAHGGDGRRAERRGDWSRTERSSCPAAPTGRASPATIPATCR